MGKRVHYASLRTGDCVRAQSVMRSYGFIPGQAARVTICNTHITTDSRPGVGGPFVISVGPSGYLIGFEEWIPGEKPKEKANHVWDCVRDICRSS